MKIWQVLAEIPSDIKEKIEGGVPQVDPDAATGNIINFVLYALGIVAVVMMIVAGVQMTTSAGDPGAVKKAKMTMTYAIIGLVVAILAYAIVNFVVGKL